MECKIFVLWFVISLMKFVCSIDQASFYGNSYISVPFKEAKSSTDIHFKFKTLLPNALILLVAGTTDYCIVRLENSRLKININLGAGESELLSQHNLKLNDLKWHDILITRKEANLSLIIDNTHKVQKHLPGRFFELNIHYGLFIGGHGNYTEIFFGHLDKFRGCLSELNYNGIMVLEQARHRQLQSVVKGITWNCAAEFEANVDRPISFVEDDAYMIISQSLHNREIKIEFEFKTIVKQGTLFYNTGHSMKLDYFLIEVFKNTIRLVIKIGDKINEINNERLISDGEWHKFAIHITANLIEIIIDDKIKNGKNLHGHLFDFSDSSYIGGLEINKRFRAMSKGCKFCDTSFKGCLRNIKINNIDKGLPDTIVSEGLLPGCLWQYPCLKNPCESNAICIQQGLDSFQCQCQQQFCLNLNYTEIYKVFSQNSLATELELLSVESLNVLEGQSVIITTNNLHMILDYQKYGIKNSGINFYTIQGPAHGSITIDLWPHEKNSFSLYDIARDKIHYIHDGSEYHYDSIIMEVEFSPIDSFLLPVYLQGRFRFSLSVTVIPVNDPPKLIIPDTAVLRLVQGTKKVINANLFKVQDPDNSPEQIVFNIIESEMGHFENEKKSGVRISSFTQDDLNNEKILFVHHSNNMNDSYISLQVSDGIETSDLTKIRVSVSPQYWRLENNTGLIVLHQTSSIITPFNLSFISNVANVDYKIQFQIVKKPHFGLIEVEKSVNFWQVSEIFTSHDLKQHRVRYRHITSNPDFDEFQFRLTVDKSALYTFRITFAKCNLDNVNINTLLLNGTYEGMILSKHLSFQTQPIKTLTTSIHYVITTPPKYGYLFSSVSKYVLRSCDLFTQEDIFSNNIKYKLHQKSYSYVEDTFSFIVLSPGCNNITENFTIIYYPLEELRTKIDVLFKPLYLDEGASVIIDNLHFNINTNNNVDLIFNVTEKPNNGVLQMNNGDLVRNNTNYFFLSELKLNQIYYIHDDSESESDMFKFMALSLKSEYNFQYVGKFDFIINLKNDNSPIRIIDKIFHVVVGGDRLLTGNDLKYFDNDLNTLPSQIVYTCRDIPNGNFYLVNNQSVKVTEFTQDDLNNNRIIFKHKGTEFGKIRLWVTDGHFHINGILEIQASAPFIHIYTNKKLIIQQGNIGVITNEHLMYTTNVFATNNDVIYEIISKPNFGKIVSTKSLKLLKNFTQDNINSGNISYVNEIYNVNADEIGLRIRCKDAVNVAQLGVLLLPSNYWEPMEVKVAKKLIIEEATSAIITKNILEIIQQNVPPSSITYFINEPPENGYITILSDQSNSDYEPLSVYSFTQDLINENRVLYIQSVTNQTIDKILFNITNGIVWENNFLFNIEIIPERLYMGSNNLKVNEGGTAILSIINLYTITEYYKSKIKEYTILHDVKYGCIQTHKRCIKSNNFTHKELLAGVVRYANDGSEYSIDELTLTAIAGTKKSVPFTLTINIIPINDQKPKLVNNTGLVMWEGGVETITKNMLAAVDEDFPMETLKFQIIHCWWGRIALKTNMSAISYFTQEQINKELVVFQHQNGSETKFRFNVTDGLHTTKEYVFHIKTKPIQLRLCSKPLHIFPLQKKYITSSHLLSIISDPNRVVTFKIVIPPSLGRLMVESETSGIFKIVTSFTQNDLNNSRIFYEHTHQFSDLYANDSLTFNVEAHLAETLKNQQLKIDISVSSGGLDAYVNIPKITLDEGGMTNIPLNLSGVVTFLENHAGLHSPIIHASANIPQHGQIFLQNNHNITTFTQEQLESGQVYYEHDHSDSLGDNIYFSFYLIPGYIILCNVTVPININPINDQPFNLVTPAPNLIVVQGENHTITRNELATEDADTPPSKLKYDLISGPTQGKLILLPDCVPVMYFTQADIDNKLLVYSHNSSVLKDSFHFRVWDEKFRPQFTLFNIIVLPINITILSGLPIYLQQGSDVVFLTERQFFIKTNADKFKLKYRIKQEPKHGVLYVKNAPSMSFTHYDLINENVMYLQTDMTTANDSFKVMAEILSANTSVGNEVDIYIKVQPLMQIKNFTVISGEYNKITLNVLDATPLVKLTNSNPRYTILNLPQYTQIRKVIRSSGEKRNVLDTMINSFTHEEIQSGLIYLVVKDIELTWNGIQDRLSFLLAASIFQPAIGEVRINIKSSLNNDLYSTLAGPNDPAGHEGGLHYASPNMTRDYFLIVSMVAGVVVLGVAVIIIIKCRSLEREEFNKEEQCLQPIPLPRPPDRLMSSSPLKQHQMDAYTTPLATALPQCKVTPLNRNNELESSHACYPYGVDEHADDWSSCDASDPSCTTKNIMLRRNQYWV